MWDAAHSFDRRYFLDERAASMLDANQALRPQDRHGPVNRCLIQAVLPRKIRLAGQRRAWLEVPASDRGAALIRHLTVSGAWCLHDSYHGSYVSDDIALIVSELTTNAVQSIRGGCGHDPIRLWLLCQLNGRRGPRLGPRRRCSATA